MENRIREARPHTTRNEGLIFERSSPGKTGAELPALDVPALSAKEILGEEFYRSEIQGFPEVSELETIRHFTRLSTWNYGIDTGLYPLGSCTMKYNPRINEAVAALEGLATDHPYTPESLAQGCLKVLALTARCLIEITGMDAISLQPAAGAQGELTGLLMMRAYHEDRNEQRKYILVLDSAHGTNPASVTIAGYEARNLKSNARGCVDLEELSRAMTEEVAGLMLTNPNTLGIFEDQIQEIVRRVHAKGGLVYMDGANMNALVGVARPGEFGIDVMHLTSTRLSPPRTEAGGRVQVRWWLRESWSHFSPRRSLKKTRRVFITFAMIVPKASGACALFMGTLEWPCALWLTSWLTVPQAYARLRKTLS